MTGRCRPDPRRCGHAQPDSRRWQKTGNDALVAAGDRAVAEAGLVYDLLAVPHQLPATIDTVRALPDLILENRR